MQTSITLKGNAGTTIKFFFSKGTSTNELNLIEWVYHIILEKKCLAGVNGSFEKREIVITQVKEDELIDQIESLLKELKESREKTKIYSTDEEKD